MTQKTRLKNLEDFGYGPNVMRNTKVCAKCGQVIKASASFCPDCGERFQAKLSLTVTNGSTSAVPNAIRC